MNAAQMAQEIITAVQAVNPDFGTPEKTEVQDELTAFCQALIDHFIANAETETNVTFGSSAGSHDGSITA